MSYRVYNVQKLRDTTNSVASLLQRFCLTSLFCKHPRKEGTYIHYFVCKTDCSPFIALDLRNE